MTLFERGSVNLARTLSSLKHRDFRLLFIGTSLSHVGDFIQVMAQSWLVWTMTSSPFLLGVVGFCQAVPRLLLGRHRWGYRRPNGASAVARFHANLGHAASFCFLGTGLF